VVKQHQYLSNLTQTNQYTAENASPNEILVGQSTQANPAALTVSKHGQGEEPNVANGEINHLNLPF